MAAHLIDDGMASKRKTVFAKLDASRKQRNAAVAARLTGGISGGEASEHFWTQFSFKVSELEAAIDKALSRAGHSIDPVAAERAVTAWTDALADIRKLVADSSLALPTYDAEKAQKSFMAIMGTFEAARAKLTPRRKFRFSDKARARLKARRQARASAGEGKAAEQAQQRAAESEAAMAALAQSEVVVAGKSGESLVVGPSGHGAEAGADLRLAELTDCTVVIMSRPGAVRVDGLVNCTVYTGAVQGSVLLHNCKNCTFMLASRQIRLHTSTDCAFFLHVHSRPIIEHCSTLTFAPYPLAYPSQGADLEAAGLQPVGAPAVAGLWKEVDDFGWHKVQASPNWAVLPPSSRPTETVHDAVTIDWTPHASYVAAAATEASSAEEAGVKEGKETDVPEEAAAPAQAAPEAAEEESDDEL